MPFNRRGSGFGWARRRGRGAAGSGFRPSQIADLALWLRADMGVTVVSGDADTWDDQSANGHQATTPANRPAFNASNADLNSRPTVDYVSASTEYMTLAHDATLQIGAAGLSWYMAGVVTTPSANRILFSKWTGATREYLFRYDNTGGFDAFIRNGADSANYSTSVAGAAGGVKHFVSVRFSDGDLRSRLDNGSEVQDTSQTGDQQSTNVIGIGAENDGTSALTVDVGEILLYQRDLADAEDSLVRGYLSTRYDI